MTKSLITIPLLLGELLCAQTASYTYIDQRPPYANPTGRPWIGDWLTALQVPRIGTSFQVEVAGSYSAGFGGISPRFAFTWLATGMRNPNFHMIGWGYLFTSAEHLVGTPSTLLPRTATMTFVIPNNTGLLGVSFYQQLVVCSPGPYAVLSRGGHGVIGR